MNWFFFILTVFLSSLGCNAAVATEPRLAFSDIVNGPTDGLGDGLGEGAIVTVWGYKLGDISGSVIFEDSTGKQRNAAYIYYWKKADGKLPGGPADLYKSHKLYEIAFSIPKSTLGLGKIIIQDSKGNRSNSLPFTVIDGRIFHIKSNGSNSNSGSYNSPWQFMNADDSRVKSPGNGMLKAGDIVYFHGTTENLNYKINPNLRAAIFVRSLVGKENAHIGFIGYPNTGVKVSSPTWGIHPYVSSAIVVSKFSVSGGILDESTGKPVAKFDSGISTNQIRTTASGRVIGNLLTDSPSQCSNGMSGSISGTGVDADNVSILGNEITGIGCIYTSHFHHTTYISRRTQLNAGPIRPGSFAWNNLHDNKAKYGIHYYDQSNDNSKQCDHIEGNLDIHDNFIKNQRSAAISVHTSSKNVCWKINTNIFNNTMINVGLGPIAEITNGTQPYALYLGGSIEGKFSVYNNLIYGVSDQSSRIYETPIAIQYNTSQDQSSISIINNIIQPLFPMRIIRDEKNIEFRNNLVEQEPADESLFTRIFGQKTANDEKTNYFEATEVSTDGYVTINSASPAIGKGVVSSLVTHDFYGRPINFNSPTIGPVQYEENDN